MFEFSRQTPKPQNKPIHCYVTYLWKAFMYKSIKKSLRNLSSESKKNMVQISSRGLNSSNQILINYFLKNWNNKSLNFPALSGHGKKARQN